MTKKILKEILEAFIAIPYIFLKGVLSLFQLFFELKIILEPFNPQEVETKVTRIGKIKENETARDDEFSEVYGYENSALMDGEDADEE